MDICFNDEANIFISRLFKILLKDRLSMTEQILAQKQKQQFQLAPQLQQSLRILQLPILELRILIESELEINPCLEPVEAKPEDPQVQNEYPIKENSDFEDIPDNDYAQHEVKLTDYLSRQLRLAFNANEELEIGELIIGSLNENGYLGTKLEELARMAGVDMALAGDVLKKIQFFDPIGCGARDIKECLLIQLNAKGKKDSLEYRLIESHLDDMANKRYSILAKKLDADINEVRAAVREVSLLEPKPARNFIGRDKTVYVVPDITVKRDGQEKYKVIIDDSELPVLRISNFYKKLLLRDNLSEEEKEFINRNIASGQNFIRGIKMRRETIRRLAEYTVRQQEEFLEKGGEFIKPLTFKQAAEALDKDETTISRAVNCKYIDTPQGLIRLRNLFSGSLANTMDSSRNISSAGVKERIRGLVEDEDKKTPLSDEEILEKLKSDNVQISRRTIAKYRNELRILPSHLRKE